MPWGALLLLLALTASAAEPGEWRVVERTSEGYEVALRDVPGRDLPALRGRGTLHGDVLHVLAILLDAARAPEWAEGASRTKILQREGPVPIVIHTVTELRWPVSDRDVVTRSRLTSDRDAGIYRLEMHATPDALARHDGTVRISHADTHFVLKRKGKDETWIEYMVDVDPAGHLPTWLVRWAAQSVPEKTLSSLQEQIERTRGAYAKQIAELEKLR